MAFVSSYSGAQIDAALRSFILTVKPSQQLTPVSNYGTFTKNPDGTVTVTSVV